MAMRENHHMTSLNLHINPMMKVPTEPPMKISFSTLECVHFHLRLLNRLAMLISSHI
jgi:hypothetical protein